ncbi:hypothetical protein [Streptacidiphilus sp. MAP5-3]|uniref:hypothetical protein n=1 Tax=unclassified Streptacidiphilus TaxID=2643834 RepID=UPI003511E69F
MTNLEVDAAAPLGSPPAGTQSHDSRRSAMWVPYVAEPLLTPRMVLGLDAADHKDRLRLTRYLAALVAFRRTPVHVNVAFNAVYFGFDLASGGYVGGPLELEAFPEVAFGQTTEALPVGAMVNIATGTEPLFAEIVYKEGAHPSLGEDGQLPAWLSGAPAGMTGPGRSDELARPVLRERLVVDVDAFGQGLSTTQTRLDRLRRRGRWLDADGHLLLNGQYDSQRDADLDEVTYYARYLLTRGRQQLLSMAAPMPLNTALSDDAGEEQLTEALLGLLRAVAQALAEIPELRLWRDYAFTRASLASRLRDPGALGGNDLANVAIRLARSAVPSRPSRWTSARTVTFTAIGPRLREVRDAAAHLTGTGYALAVCHANAVVSDYARRETDEQTGLLPGGVHLRLDDPWQGGGVWRAEYPDSAYTRVEVTEPLGLGWLETLPTALPQEAPAPVPEPPLLEDEEDDEGETQLSVTDSQVSWTHTLRLAHLLGSRLPLPQILGTHMRDAGLSGVRLRLMLTHDGYDLDPAEAAQAVESELAGRVQLCGVEWPWEFFPSIVLTCTWPRGAGVIRATSTLLECPVTIDGQHIEHRYDASVLTREAAPGTPRRGGVGAGTLTLAQRVLRAVRCLGRLEPGGSTVLARSSLPIAVYGRPDDLEAAAQAGETAAMAALGPAVDELIAAGDLREEIGSLNEGRRVQYPAVPGQQPIVVLVYEPLVVEGPPRPTRSPTQRLLEKRFVRDHPVAGHLRDLRSSGRTASEDQRAAYREDRKRFGLAGPAELPDGYTYIRPFRRGH